MQKWNRKERKEKDEKGGISPGYSWSSRIGSAQFGITLFLENRSR